MEIHTHIAEGVCGVRLCGRFTFGDHPGFRAILQHIAEEEVGQVILDMSQVDFVDSAALGMLLLSLDEAEKHHKQLVISGVKGQVKTMFDRARFNTLFTMG